MADVKVINIRGGDEETKHEDYDMFHDDDDNEDEDEEYDLESIPIKRLL